jgi:hypothetical protein
MSDVDFNEWYEVGHPVILTDDFGKEHKTVTTSKAWNLCGTSVVNCEGWRAYNLSRIKPMEAHS